MDCTTLNKGVATKQIGHVRHAYTRPVLQSVAHRQKPLKHFTVRAGDIEKEEDNVRLWKKEKRKFCFFCFPYEQGLLTLSVSVSIVCRCHLGYALEAYMNSVQYNP